MSVGVTQRHPGLPDGHVSTSKRAGAAAALQGKNHAALQLLRSDPDLDRQDWDQAVPQDAEGVEPVRVGVIGYGYWGPNLVRNFAESPSSEVAQVADVRRERLAPIERRYPGVLTTTDYRDLLKDPSIDAIVISTPISTHFDLALASLQAGKHVLVEKTLTANSEQAMRLIEEAERRQLVLMVDHTFVYTGAVQKIKELVDAGRIGRVYYWDSVRVNLGLFQPDVNVLWDLAVHDLSIMDAILGVKPTAVAATGVSIVPGRPINTGYLTCFFEGNLLAHFHVNWLAPVKIRRTLIGGDAQMIVYDDLEPSEKVKVYDRSVTLDTPSEAVYQLMVDYRIGDMWAPRVNLTEALRVETQHFVECVRTGRQSLTDGRAGLRVVRILEAASKSLHKGGQPVEVDWDGKNADSNLPPAQRQREISTVPGSSERPTIGSHPHTRVG
jgi:predicted dehydrogenase